MIVLLQSTSLTAVIKSPVCYNKIFDSSYGVFFGEMHMSNFRKDLTSFGLLLGAAEAPYRRYARVTRPMRRYPEALQLFELVINKSPPVTVLPGKVGSASRISKKPCLWRQKRKMLYFLSTELQFIRKKTRKKKDRTRCSALAHSAPLMPRYQKR